MGIGPQPGLLDDVFRLGVVAQDRQGGPVDALVVPAQQELEELDLSRADPGDGFFIREYCGLLSLRVNP